MRLVMPWPAAGLAPNRTEVNRWKKAASKAAQRAEWAAEARKQGAKASTAHGLHVILTYCPPDRRRRDLDNLLAASKSGLDGLADVLGIDDCRWIYTLRRGHVGQYGAQVLVDVHEVAA